MLRPYFCHRMSAQLTFFIFNVALLPFYPLLFVYTLWRRLVQKKSAGSFAGQWGCVPREVRDALSGDTSTSCIWLHAVSVGETMAARPIARALKEVLPHCRIALSCTTDTGFETAQAARKTGEVDAVLYFPLDVAPVVWRALNAVSPEVFITVETELWPTFLHIAHNRGVLCFLANGRVSDNLYKNAARQKWLWRWIFSNLDGVLMRSEFDSQRIHDVMQAVGAARAQTRVLTLGDVKLDGASSPEELQTLREHWRQVLHIGENELLWVCGSTHPAIKDGESAEEEIILRVYRDLKERYPLRLLLAPRHGERVNEVMDLCQRMQIPACRRTQIESSSGNQVIVLDTVGELANIYAAGDIAFVGGSLVKRGGHNVLEPVQHGVPVLFGPHMANFRAAAALVQQAALGGEVQGDQELRAQVDYWLSHPQERSEIDNKAREVLEPHHGAALRIAQHVAERLKSKSNLH